MTAAAQKALWPSRGWWAALAAILMLAGFLCFTGYRLGLPYIENPDEPPFYVYAENESTNHPLSRVYPPAYRVMYVGLHAVAPGLSPPAQVNFMRQLSVLTFLACGALAALLAYEVAGAAAGLLAAALWGFEPHVVSQAHYALPDVYVALFTVGAALSGVLVLRTGKQRWVYLSTGGALLAFLFKYHAIAILPAILLVLLVYRPPEGWRRYRKAVFISGGASALALVWMLFGYGALDIIVYFTKRFGWEGEVSEGSMTLPSTFSFDYLRENLASTIGSYGLIAVLASAGFIMFIFWRASRRRVDGWALAVLFAAILALFLVLATLQAQPYRRLYPLIVLLMALAGVGLSTGYHLLGVVLSKVSSTRQAWMQPVVAAVLVVLLLAPAVSETWAAARIDALRDNRVDLMEWADATLPPGPYLAGSGEFHKVFNRAWGGYTGANDFAIHRTAPIVAEPVDTWRAAGVQYAVLLYGAYQQLHERPDIGRPYLDETLLLKTFPASPERRGPDIAVLRMYPIRQPLGVDAVNFNDEIELIGYDLSSDHARPGETIMLAPYWRAIHTPAADYIVYNHLAPLDSREMVAQADGPPLASARRPTTTWDDPDEVFIGQPFLITIGADVPPGEYRLLTGLYDRETGQRLPVVGAGADYAVLFHITVLSE